MTEQEALIEEWVIRTLNSSMHGFLMNREKHSASDNRSPPEDKILMRVDRFIDLLPELVQTIADAGQRGNNGELHADRVSPAEWTAIIRTRRDHDHDDVHTGLLGLGAEPGACHEIGGGIG